MKKILPIVVLAVLVSCKEYKALMAEETKFNLEKKIMFNNEDKESFNVDINGVEHNLFFDTGAGVTLINKPKFDLISNKIIKQKLIYGFNKKTKSSSITYSVDSVKTSLFTTKDKYLYISDIENIKNCSNQKYDGILGNFFLEVENEIELNYEKGFIEISNNPISKSGYIMLESKFNSNSGKFSVKISVNDIFDYFLFDTGNKTGIILNEEIYRNLSKKITTLCTMNEAVNSTIIKAEFDIYQSIFKLSDDLAFNQYVAIDKTSKRSVLNQQFIKKFNWIIDKKREGLL